MLKIKLPKRRADSHKGDYGRALVIAGSEGMLGAACLASRGALRAGAGLTYLAVPKELVNFANTMTPEVIVLPFDRIKGVKADAIAIGPGIGRSDILKKTIHSFDICHPPAVPCTAWRAGLTFVIDADALNIIARDRGIRDKLRGKSGLVLTPHPGELSRLLGQSVESIQKDRVAAAKKAAKEFGGIVVLKGYRTVVADDKGKVHVNKTGNPGMASGGVGDVLTGMIAGLAAQGLSAWEAATAGVYAHGLAGDLAAREKGQYALIASDLVEKIPNALSKVC